MKLKELLEITEFSDYGATVAPAINLMYGIKDDLDDKFELEQHICKIRFAVPGEMVLAPHLLQREVVKIYLENGCVNVCLGELYDGEDI